MKDFIHWLYHRLYS